MLEHPFLCVVAPRESGKTTACVSNVAWSIWRNPLEVMLFSNTEERASHLKRKIDRAVGIAAPDLMPRRTPSDRDTRFTNGATIEAAGIGASKRGAHPDLIIVDDALSKEHAHDWFFGDVMGMGPKRLLVLGTPFHESDLLMGDLRKNSHFRWYRFAAEYVPERMPLAGSLAVEVGGMVEREPDAGSGVASARARALAHRKPDATSGESKRREGSDGNGGALAPWKDSEIGKRISSALKDWPR
jgi:hypothetical protein